MQQFLCLKKTSSLFEQDLIGLYNYRHRHHYHYPYYSYHNSIIVTIDIIIIPEIWKGRSFFTRACSRKRYSDSLDEFLDTFSTCAHHTQRLAILRIFFLSSIFGLIHFFLIFFNNLTRNRRKMGFTSILNALPLRQTVWLNVLTQWGVSAAEYSWDVQISCLTHTDPNF